MTTAPSSGQLHFIQDQASATITVRVYGDQNYEPDETFFVDLSNPIGALIISGQERGTGTILNDDKAPTAASKATVGKSLSTTSNSPNGTCHGQVRHRPQLKSTHYSSS